MNVEDFLPPVYENIHIFSKSTLCTNACVFLPKFNIFAALTAEVSAFVTDQGYILAESGCYLQRGAKTSYF